LNISGVSYLVRVSYAEDRPVAKEAADVAHLRADHRDAPFGASVCAVAVQRLRQLGGGERAGCAAQCPQYPPLLLSQSGLRRALTHTPLGGAEAVVAVGAAAAAAHSVLVSA